MDIVVTGRNMNVPAHYRVHVANQLSHLERYNGHINRYEVVLHREPNPRQAKTCQRVEITGTGDSTTVRAEASGSDFYTGLSAAVDKLDMQMRRNHDRLRVHHGRHQPRPVSLATALIDTATGPLPAETPQTGP
jgi:ribosomal subunit interface protein